MSQRLTSKKVKKGKQTALILFGSTGDLAMGKLIPSLLSLYKNKILTDTTRIVCVGRKSYSSKTYKQFVTEQFRIQHSITKDEERSLKKFFAGLVYVSGDPSHKDAYIAIQKALREEFTTGRIEIASYLAVPQDLHTTIAIHLVKYIFSKKKYVCRYVAIEKPFGYDKKTAKALYVKLTRYISPKHIVLVDHYLYKWPIIELETLLKEHRLYVGQERVDTKDITGVHAMLEETKKVEHRLDFYDKVGALRDVGQNHVLQMLLSVLSLGGDKKAKLKEMKNLFLSTDTMPVFSTYAGYKGSPMTDTYFKVKLKSKSKLWHKANIYISGGKGLQHSKSGIEITLFGNTKFFVNANSSDKGKHGAYDLLIRDILYGAPLSVSFEEVALAWKICEKIIKK